MKEVLKRKSLLVTIILLLAVISVIGVRSAIHNANAFGLSSANNQTMISANENEDGATWVFPLRTEAFWRELYNDAQLHAKNKTSVLYNGFVSDAKENSESSSVWFVAIYDATTYNQTFSEWIQTVISVTEKYSGSEEMCAYLQTLVTDNSNKATTDNNNIDDNNDTPWWQSITLIVSVSAMLLLVIAVVAIVGMFTKSKTNR